MSDQKEDLKGHICPANKEKLFPALVLDLCLALFIGNIHLYNFCSSSELLFCSLVGKDTNCCSFSREWHIKLNKNIKKCVQSMLFHRES